MVTKVMLVDDHKLFLSGLVALIGKFENVEVVGTAGDGNDLLSQINYRKPDLILLDLNMPNLNGFDTLDALKGKYPDVKVIVISMFDGDNYISKAIEHGACGYLHKNAEPDEIETAIANTMELGFYFNEKTNKAMLHRLVSRKMLKPVFAEQSLTFNDSELGVIKYVCAELTSSEIADKLYLSKRTVEGIRQQLIQKTGSKNVVGLVLFATKNGLIAL